VQIPSTAELQRAFDYLRVERVKNPTALAVAIFHAITEAPKLIDFIECHTQSGSAFANGVLFGLKIAELREQDAAHAVAHN
jgi:hypothetical protein